MSNSIIRCYLNSDLRAGHDGLAKVALKDKIRVQELSPGEFVIFINARKDKVKVYAAQNVVAYLRSPSGRIDMNTIREIPRVFNGAAINYDAALKKILSENLLKRNRHVVSPLEAQRLMKKLTEARA